MDKFFIKASDGGLRVSRSLLLKIPFFENLFEVMETMEVTQDDHIVQLKWSTQCVKRALELATKRWKRRGKESEDTIDAIQYLYMFDCIESDKDFLSNIFNYRFSLISEMLLEHQIVHVDNLAKAMCNNRALLDVSSTGLGKTYTSCALASCFTLPLFVVCCKNVIGKWECVAKRFGVKIVHISTFQGFAYKNRNDYIAKHGWLACTDGKKYIPTEKLFALIKSGALFVIDEAHFAANNTTFNSSLATVIRVIHSVPNTESRAILLSAYPIDGPQKKLNIFKLLGGCGKYREWWEVDRSTVPNTIIPKGVLNLEKWGIKLRPSQNKVLELKSVVMEAFDILSDQLVFSMNANYQCRVIVTNLFCRGTPDEIEDAMVGVQQMRGELQENNKLNSITSFMAGLRKVQNSKTNIIVRLALRNLAETHSSKVVLFIPSIDAIDAAAMEIEDAGYDALILTGNIKPEKRGEIIEKFNADSGDYRVLLTNAFVSATGVDLDDKGGNRKRFMYFVPIFNFLNTLQSFGRFLRTDTKSDTEVFLVYHDSLDEEFEMLRKLNHKDKAVSELISKTFYSDAKVVHGVEI